MNQDKENSDKNELVTISLKEYKQLNFDSKCLRALEIAGVNNWEGYSEANLPDEEDFLI